MSGFFGDLSASQQDALREMKELHNGVDDHTMLRFLRARQFVVKDASDMYRNYAVHRKESGIEKILKAKMPKADLWKTFVPHAFHGFDLEGRPIYIEKTGRIDFDAAYQHLKDEDFLRHHLWQMEYLIEKCKEGSQRTGKVVDNFCSIVDLDGLSMAARKGLKFIRMMAAHDQQFYPERLGKLYIINAPWVFPTFWKICKIWLDPNTIKKIEVLGKNFKKTLLEKIPAEFVPQEYGGKCSCHPDGKCIPVADLTPFKAGASLDEELKHHDAVEKHIGSKEIHEVKLSCEDKGAEFHWVFKAQSKDIQFSVSVVSANGDLEWSTSVDGFATAEDERASTSVHRVPSVTARKERVVIEPEKVTSAQGSYACKGAATIIFRWDNSYSRFTSKNIRYLLRAIPLSESEAHDPLDLHGKLPILSKSFSTDIDRHSPVLDDVKTGTVDDSALPKPQLRIHEEIPVSTPVS